MENILLPEQWSQVACDILAQKYFRKAGVPGGSSRLRSPEYRPGSGALRRIWRRWLSFLKKNAMALSRTVARSSTALRAPGLTGHGRRLF